MEWMDNRRYKDNPSNQCLKLDLPALDAQLILKNDQYCLVCPELGFNYHVVDNEVETAKLIAIKLISYELDKKVHLYQALLRRINEKRSAKNGKAA